jgi:hypothetical protein
MEKKHWKRGNKAYTRSPTLIYMTYCKKKTQGDKSLEGVTLNVKREVKEQKKKRKIRSMKTRGVHEDKDILFREGILSGGLTLCY